MLRMALVFFALWTGAAFANCTGPVPMQTWAAPKPKDGSARVALALGSGSMHGLAHIGVIQELEAKGLSVQVVTGTSVGALVGALWSSGLTGTQIERMSAEGDWESLGRLTLSAQGFMSNAQIREQLARVFRGRPIQAWPRTFGAVATNLETGDRRILSSGDGALAVQASSAVPVLFQPVTIRGERLADGALVEPIPVDSARTLGATYVIAVDVAYRPYEEEVRGLSSIAFQTTHILMNALGMSQLRKADFAIRLDLHQRMMDCGAASLVAAGREAVRRAWPTLAASLPGTQ